MFTNFNQQLKDLLEALQLKPKDTTPRYVPKIDPEFYRDPKKKFLSDIRRKWKEEPTGEYIKKDVTPYISGTEHLGIEEFKDTEGHPANIRLVSYEDLSKSIRNTLNLSQQDPEVRTRKPLLIFGPPGIGKSQIVKEESRKYAQHIGRKFIEYNRNLDVDEIRRNAQEYFVFVDIRMSYYDPTELRGIPLINTDKDFITHLTESWINMLCEPAIAGVVFLDELVQAQVQTRAVGYQISLERKVAENKFSDFVTVMAASNWGEEAGVVSDPLPRALEDRFSIVYLNISAREWLGWATRSGKFHEDILGFVRSNLEKNFIDIDAPIRKQTVYATIGASPRGIEAANDAYIAKLRELDEKEKKGEEIVDFGKEIVQALTDTVGAKWGRDFLVYLGYYKQIQWDKFITDPSIIKQKDQLSYTWTYITRLIRHIKEQKDVNSVKLLYDTWSHLNREDRGLLYDLIVSDKEIIQVFKTIYPQPGAKKMIESIYDELEKQKKGWTRPGFDKPKDSIKAFGEGFQFETNLKKLRHIFDIR